MLAVCFPQEKKKKNLHSFFAPSNHSSFLFFPHSSTSLPLPVLFSLHPLPSPLLPCSCFTSSRHTQPGPDKQTGVTYRIAHLPYFVKTNKQSKQTHTRRAYRTQEDKRKKDSEGRGEAPLSDGEATEGTSICHNAGNWRGHLALEESRRKEKDSRKTSSSRFICVCWLLSSLLLLRGGDESGRATVHVEPRVFWESRR